MHMIPYRYRSFQQKSPLVSGSFVQNDLQFKACYASSPPCTTACAQRGIVRLLPKKYMHARVMSYVCMGESYMYICTYRHWPT